jgi:hypothetical protein
MADEIQSKLPGFLETLCVIQFNLLSFWFSESLWVAREKIENPVL